jgi:hypothetical protein
MLPKVAVTGCVKRAQALKFSALCLALLFEIFNRFLQPFAGLGKILCRQDWLVPF